MVCSDTGSLIFFAVEGSLNLANGCLFHLCSCFLLSEAKILLDLGAPKVLFLHFLALRPKKDRCSLKQVSRASDSMSVDVFVFSRLMQDLEFYSFFTFELADSKVKKWLISDFQSVLAEDSDRGLVEHLLFNQTVQLGSLESC